MNKKRTLQKIACKKSFSNEAEVEAYASDLLRKAGYVVKFRKTGDALIDKNWPTKQPSKKNNSSGQPDILLAIEKSSLPICVWENKAPPEPAEKGLSEAKSYIEGLREALPHKPGLPRIAAGFNGKELLVSYYDNDGKWLPIICEGIHLQNAFPIAACLENGISSKGIFNAVDGAATEKDLRNILPRLKTLYRKIPVLASGRTPIDFTVALLTLKLLVEQNPEWGSWAEQPRFASGSKSLDHGIAEQFKTLTKRILDDKEMQYKYGDIFEFHEKNDTSEIAFSFIKVLSNIEQGKNNFVKLFELLDGIPPLIHADFDIFGEVYQFIGDEATKKALGEFFTGRHIISAVIPIVFHRAGFDKSYKSIRGKKIADIACGTGGFLTEALRWVRRSHNISEEELKDFAGESFVGYDLGHANASRARVNMYFAGDGFSVIEGGIDSLSEHEQEKLREGSFDLLMTNPPYGKSSYGRAEEAFLLKTLKTIKSGTGWGLIVLPTGVLENPRSKRIRFQLIKEAQITDIISLPKHAFAPYTQQRTGIIIFNKRKSPLPVPEMDWNLLKKYTKDERVSLFIIDNDGYANSDKRYPTSRKNKNGMWLHNDLADWIDKKGLKHHSKIYNALVNEIRPNAKTNEFGEPLGAKYKKVRIGALFNVQRGVDLLPDNLLRKSSTSIPFREFIKRTEDLLKYVKTRSTRLRSNFLDELGFLLSHPVDFGSATSAKMESLASMFDMLRGDQGLTESIIYTYFDDNGLYVYGGGALPPKYKISRNARNNKGVPVTVFKGPAIIVSMDGSSGSMRVIEKEEFCSNHHARVLTPKKGIKINPYFVMQQAEGKLKEMASNKGGSKTLTIHQLHELEITIPKDPKIVREIGMARKKLLELKDKFAS